MVDLFPWGSTIFCVCSPKGLLFVSLQLFLMREARQRFPVTALHALTRYEEGFLKNQNVFLYLLTKSLVNVFYSLPLSASALLVKPNRHFSLEFSVHVMKSSVILQDCF